MKIIQTYLHIKRNHWTIKWRSQLSSCTLRSFATSSQSLHTWCINIEWCSSCVAESQVKVTVTYMYYAVGSGVILIIHYNPGAKSAVVWHKTKINCTYLFLDFLHSFIALWKLQTIIMVHRLIITNAFVSLVKPCIFSPLKCIFSLT